jgi:glycosyltransferase involved in cell wall biosynthesis
MKYNILVEGPYLTQSGYGEHARLVLQCLRTRPDVEIFGLPLPWGQTSWLSDDTEDRQWLDDISLKTSTESPESFDLHVFIGMPVEFKKKAPKAVCVTAGIEVDRVDPQWLIKSYEIDKIIVPSIHSKSVFENSGYKTGEDEAAQHLSLQCPIEVVPYSIREYESTNDLELDISTGFNFLAIAQWGPRKNLENMISWFVEEFKNNKDIGLILKTGMARNCNMDFEVTKLAIKNTLAVADPDASRKCKIYLLHGDLTTGQLGDLYTKKKIKAVISATYGEGFGLPLFEAASHKLPVVATNATGHVDFLYAKNKNGKITPHFLPVEFSVNEVPPQSVWEGVITAGAKWYYPDKASFKNQIREVYKNYNEHKTKAVTLYKNIKERFSTSEIKEQMNTEIISVLESDLEELDVRTLE